MARKDAKQGRRKGFFAAAESLYEKKSPLAPLRRGSLLNAPPHFIYEVGFLILLIKIEGDK